METPLVSEPGTNPCQSVHSCSVVTECQEPSVDQDVDSSVISDSVLLYSEQLAIDDVVSLSKNVKMVESSLLSETSSKPAETLIAPLSEISSTQVETLVTPLSEISSAQVETLVTPLSEISSAQVETLVTPQVETLVTPLSEISSAQVETLVTPLSEISSTQVETLVTPLSEISSEQFETLVGPLSEISSAQVDTLVADEEVLCSTQPEMSDIPCADSSVKCTSVSISESSETSSHLSLSIVECTNGEYSVRLSDELY